MKGGNKMNNKNLTIVLVIVALAIGAYFVMQDRESLGPPGTDSKKDCICPVTQDIIDAAKAECTLFGGLNYIYTVNNCEEEDSCLTKRGCYFVSRCVNEGSIYGQTRDCTGLTQI